MPAYRAFEDCEPQFPGNSLERCTFLRSARRLLELIQEGRRKDRMVHTVCSRAPRRGSSNAVLRANGDTVAMVVVNCQEQIQLAATQQHSNHRNVTESRMRHVTVT